MQNYDKNSNRMEYNGVSRARAGIISLMLLLCLVTAGCGASSASDSAYNGAVSSSPKAEADYEYSMDAAEGMALGDMIVNSSTGGSATSSGDSLQAVSSRKLITTVSMETETEHYDDLMTWLSARIAEYGGYVEYSESYGNQSSRRSANITIRIPADSLDLFLTGLSEESNVTYQSRSVKDVTLSYVDVESHKAALLIEQERLMELLEKADSLEDLLTIESRLTEVRYELESYESQLRTYDNQIHYSTVDLTIREVKVLSTPEPESFWERVTEGFTENLQDVAEGFTEFAIAFLSSIPTLIVWAVILGIAFLILRKVNRARRNRRNSDASGAEPGVSKEKKKKSKKRWGKGAKGGPQETDSPVYQEADPFSQTEKKDGE